MTLDRAVPPPVAPPPPPRLPAFAPLQVPAGPRIRACGEHHLPEVSLRLIVEAGSAREASRQAGLADLTARLLREGAAGRTALEIAAWLDRIGAVFRADAGYDVTVASMHTLSDQLDESLAFLAAVVREPAFDPKEVERVRDQRVDELQRRREDPAHRADEVLLRRLYGVHPYGVPAVGTPATVAHLDAEAVSAFHRAAYRPVTMTLIACGTLDPARLQDRLEVLFGGGEDRVADHSITPVPKEPSGARCVLVDRPGSPQSEIRVGAIGIARGSPDEFDVRVMNAILGGVFHSRLNMNLREEKGWTYGVRSSAAMRRAPGPFVIRTAVNTENTADAVSEILAEIEQVRHESPEAEEVERAQMALMLSLPRRFETVGQLVARTAESVTYGLPETYWSRYGERIRAVTSEGVLAAARRLLDAERLRVVVVGDAGRVGPELETRVGEMDRLSWEEELDFR